MNRGLVDHLQLRLPYRRLEPQELHLVRVHLQLRLSHVGRHLLLLTDRQGRRVPRVRVEEAGAEDERRKLEVQCGESIGTRHRQLSERHGPNTMKKFQIKFILLWILSILIGLFWSQDLFHPNCVA